MRQLETYKIILTQYNDFLTWFYKNGKPKKPVPIEILKCSFFDWIRYNFKIDVVVASVYKSKPTYIDSDSADAFFDMKLPYIEVQMCVYNNDIISEKSLEGEI